MRLNKNQEVFFELVRAGLWEKEARLSQFNDIDYEAVMEIAEEQSVVGLVTAGLEHIDVRGQKEDVRCRPSQEMMLQFVGETLQIEQQNKDMNMFLGRLIEELRKEDVYAVLVKGQGIAQCYERPLWRASGDIDFYLSESNYQAAKDFLTPLATQVDIEDYRRLHLGMSIDPWVVELHGTMHLDFSTRINRGLDEVHKNIFYGGEVRSWNNDGTLVFLPSADNDIILVFTHILQHFFKEGIGLRQICDWCRLLWTYRDKINIQLLEKRLHSMALLTEWRVFASLAVNILGMPVEAMPLYSNSHVWQQKSSRVLSYILKTGSFGHYRDYSYYEKYPYLVYKMISLWHHTIDGIRYYSVFPLDSMKVWWQMLLAGIKLAFKGK